MKPSVGREAYSAAKEERREMRIERDLMRRVRPWRRKMRSALLFHSIVLVASSE